MARAIFYLLTLDKKGFNGHIKTLVTSWAEQLFKKEKYGIYELDRCKISDKICPFKVVEIWVWCVMKCECFIEHNSESVRVYRGIDKKRQKLFYTCFMNLFSS